MPSSTGSVSILGRLFAWTGALLFAASLSYFLFTYTVTFGETQQSGPVAAAVTWDLVLFTLFALHHSLFARERVRAVVARTVPAALERSCYVWLASLLFFAVCALWRPLPGVVWALSSDAAWLMYAVLAAGVWLSIQSASAIDIWELAGVRQAQDSGRANATPPVFKTSGPYGFVRHPIYLGWFLMVFGVPVMTATRLTFALVSCAYLILAIPLEERTLRETTDGKYDEYVRLVRWRLIPGVY